MLCGQYIGLLLSDLGTCLRVLSSSLCVRWLPLFDFPMLLVFCGVSVYSIRVVKWLKFLSNFLFPFSVDVFLFLSFPSVFSFLFCYPLDLYITFLSEIAQ